MTNGVRMADHAPQKSVSHLQIGGEVGPVVTQSNQQAPLPRGTWWTIATIARNPTMRDDRCVWVSKRKVRRGVGLRPAALILDSPNANAATRIRCGADWRQS